MRKFVLIACCFFICLMGQSQNSTTQPTSQKKQVTTATSGSKTAMTKPKKDEYPGVTHLGIGEKLPMMDLEMDDISGEKVALKDVIGDNGLLLVFSCNTCPFVVAYEDRYPMIQEMAESNNIGYAILNPNERKRQTDNNDDSIENMKAHAAEMNYDCLYLVDKNHKVADAIGAFRTPDVFLFDGQGNLVYKGAIDDNWKNKEEVKNNYLADAMNKMLKGEKIEFPDVKGRGCSIKRLEK